MAPQALTVISAARRVRRAALATWTRLQGQPVAVLNYHRINKKTLGENNLTVTPECFDSQMQILARCYQVIPVSQIAKVLTTSKRASIFRKPLVAITFDDGYLDTLTEALPVLQKYQIPACVYVSVGYTGKQQEFWWDELETLLLGIGPQDLLKVSKLDWNLWGCRQMPALDSLELRMAAYHQLAAHFKKSPPEQVTAWMTQLRDALNRSPDSRTEYRAMTREELVQLASSPLIEIGSHTVNHPSLGRIAPEQQESELGQSKAQLEDWLGREIDSVAFPFGGHEDFSDTTLAIAKRLGYRTAFTTVCGVVDSRSDLLAMPRMYVQDWSSQDFLRRLQRFLWLA